MKPEAAIVVVMVVLAFCVGVAGYIRGYERGQQDGLRGKWDWQRVEASDGKEHFVHLDK